MNKLFSRQQPVKGLQGVLDQLRSHVNQGGSSSFAPQEIGSQMLALESLDSVALSRVHNAVGSLEQALESICNDMGATFKPGIVQAGVAGGLMASNVVAQLKHQPAQFQSTPTHKFVPAKGAVDRLAAALEAYDEKENKNAAVYSVAYNMQAARQDEFGEALFPTVVVTPDQVGFTLSIHLVRVMNDIRRQTTGALTDFGFKNIVHAVRDPSILQNDATNIVPIYRAGAEGNFVSNTVLPTKTIVTQAGESQTTSALAFGKSMDLLALSQLDSLVATGLMDVTDAIDPALRLANIYMTVTGTVGSTPTTEVLVFPVKALPLATFTYNPQDNFRSMVVNFNSSSLTIDGSQPVLTSSGSVSALLPTIHSGNYVIKLSAKVFGSVNLQTGACELVSGGVSVSTITGTDDVEQPPTSAGVSAIAALFNGAALVGYDLDGRRTNSNRRQRGQLLDVTVFNQSYAVPLLAPISIPRPLGQGDGTDAADLAALITATRIRTSNSAVDALLDAATTLSEFVTGREAIADTVEVMGPARFLLNAFYSKTTYNAALVTQTLNSAERAADIQAALVSAIRDIAYRMYRDSGYKAAADALQGGQSEAPTVIIATDPVISRYLTVTGDLRTLGNDFKVKIVSTLNVKMTGKIFITFGDFNGTEGAPNPMHFGNMAWKPEMTLVLPIHRNGANSKELTVQPSYLHIVNLPILAEMDVSNISDLVLAGVTYQVSHGS